MPQPIMVIDGIEPLNLPATRQSIGPLHAFLRECILDGRLAPGTALSQVALGRRDQPTESPPRSRHEVRQTRRPLSRDRAGRRHPRVAMASTDPIRPSR
ncbi:hypothetical protein GCM10010339_59790 [Streptomyces alanosinicus]|uniref:Uncharacterized protein n=1 Tax=Streptomyces alanosinicus TaxID=68171 RepID=A0A918YNG8_9ACTN|nr:hypothetical protein GCM10010339_59790 [Streptomyces alanosinicus]